MFCKNNELEIIDYESTVGYTWLLFIRIRLDDFIVFFL